MEPKIYQQKAIDKLNEYLQSLKTFSNNPEKTEYIKRTEQKGVYVVPYILLPNQDIKT